MYTENAFTHLLDNLLIKFDKCDCIAKARHDELLHMTARFLQLNTLVTLFNNFQFLK